MRLRSIALKNVKENWRSYSAFFLSSVFSVAIFFIYIAFVEHPDIKSGAIMGADSARQVMSYCLYIIGIFSFIFIMYSSSSFIKTRKKEFGLLSLFGMTRFQLRRLIFFENMLIGFFSTLVGIGAGILFSKLFLLALGSILNLDGVIRFAIPSSSVITTLIVFVSIFLVMTINSSIRIGRGEIIEHLNAYKKPKGEIKYSRFLAILGFILLTGGYTLAYFTGINSFVITVLPILVLTISGTYLLYTQLSVLVLRILRRNKGLFYKRSNLLIVSQLVYKIKDNAKILFTISILSAVVMTAMGTIYTIKVTGEKSIIAAAPYTVLLAEPGDATKGVITREALLEQFEKHKLIVKEETQYEGMVIERYKASLDDGKRKIGTIDPNPESGYEGYNYDALLISLSQYKQSPAAKALQLESGQAALYVPEFTSVNNLSGTLTGSIGDHELQLTIQQATTENIPLNLGYKLSAVVVIPDEDYAKLNQISNHKSVQLYGFEINNWRDGYPLTQEMSSHYKDGKYSEEMSNIDMWMMADYHEFNQMIGLTIFIGLFISLLFFIASGSIVYFKLYTERDEDIQMFKGLSRIGISYSEMKKVVVSQIAIIFFLPCIVGVLHASFAMIALDNLLTDLNSPSNWTYSFVVFGIYVAMQLLYFVLSSRSYLSSIKKGSKTAT